MACELQNLLQTHIQRGIISIPVGYSKHAYNATNPNFCLPRHPIEIIEGAKDNIPDEASLSATQRIVEMIQPLKPSDILFVLISGGGSALAPLPKPPLSLGEKSSIIQSLSKAGASIEEINLVRTRLSAWKGGQLLRYTKAKVLTLILSDVIDSPLHLIASGPTVIPPLGTNSSELALAVLQR